MAEATITSKGQITIPATVRNALGLKTGTRIRFLEDEDGRFSFVPVTGSIRAMKGIVPKLGRTVSLEEMDQAISEGACRGMKPAR
jgi:AbrB family looped-hinge helix DNA binding protein